MDERAEIPVSLPHDHPTVCYWQAPPDCSVADLRSTPDLPQSTDVVIIGSGISGASVAWHLLNSFSSLGYDAASSDEGADKNATPSGLDIVMLEARQACSGATGRNGQCACLISCSNGVALF